MQPIVLRYAISVVVPVKQQHDPFGKLHRPANEQYGSALTKTQLTFNITSKVNQSINQSII